MDEQQLLGLKPELDRFLDRFAPLFGPDANQVHARRFVQGLLRGGEQRRNAENIAETMSAVGPCDHCKLSRPASGLIARFSPSCAVWSSKSSATMTPSGTQTRRVSRRRETRQSASAATVPGPWAEPTTARSPCLPNTPRPRDTPSWIVACTCPRSGPATATVGRRPVYQRV